MHLLRFKSVDTTMRIAEEFAEKKSYTSLISDASFDDAGVPVQSLGLEGFGIAFQADEQT